MIFRIKKTLSSILMIEQKYIKKWLFYIFSFIYILLFYTIVKKIWGVKWPKILGHILF